MVIFLRISIKAKFFKTLMNQKTVQGQNKHNNENQTKSLGRELCDYYNLGLHKRPNSSRHCVCYLVE